MASYSLQAVCVQKKKCRGKINTTESAPPKTHHDIHINPATATTSRRRATKHVPRVSPHALASMDPEFVDIGLVQLSQLHMAKTASVASFPRPVVLQQLRKSRKILFITVTSNRYGDPHRASHSVKPATSGWKESQTRSELGVTSCGPL